MIIEGIKAKRSADKASAIFLYAGEYKKHQRVLQHVPEQQLRYYRIAVIFIPYCKRSKICGYSPYKNTVF
jgi:hypothetical protein